MVNFLLTRFTVGVASFLIFHQGSVSFFYHVGNSLPAIVGTFGRATAVPFNFTPVPDFYSLPLVVVQIFWSGIWGALLALFKPNRIIFAFVFAVIFGSIVVSMFTISFIPIFLWMNEFFLFPEWQFGMLWYCFLNNGAWGFGVFLLLLCFRRDENYSSHHIEGASSIQQPYMAARVPPPHPLPQKGETG